MQFTATFNTSVSQTYDNSLSTVSKEVSHQRCHIVANGMLHEKGISPSKKSLAVRKTIREVFSPVGVPTP